MLDTSMNIYERLINFFVQICFQMSFLKFSCEFRKIFFHLMICGLLTCVTLIITLLFSLTDGGEDSKLVHRRIWAKVCTAPPRYLLLLITKNNSIIRRTSMTQRMVENTLHTLVHFRLYRLTKKIAFITLQYQNVISLPRKGLMYINSMI